MPAECTPAQMGLLESLRHWIQWQVSWKHDPCENYHRALIIDPIWEVPPMMVMPFKIFIYHHTQYTT